VKFADERKERIEPASYPQASSSSSAIGLDPFSPTVESTLHIVVNLITSSP
jgi:hypothetical protein